MAGDGYWSKIERYHVKGLQMDDVGFAGVQDELWALDAAPWAMRRIGRGGAVGQLQGVAEIDDKVLGPVRRIAQGDDRPAG